MPTRIFFISGISLHWHWQIQIFISLPSALSHQARIPVSTKVTICLFSLFLLGCSGYTKKTPKLQVASSSKIAQQEEVKEKTAVSAQVLFLIITAEIAEQKGEYAVALRHYIQAAQQTDSSIIAKKATKIALALKNHQQTAIAVALWLGQDAKNPTARKIATLTALRNEDYAMAGEHLNQILQQDPAGFYQFCQEISQILTQDGMGQRLLPPLEYLSKLHPRKSSVLFVTAMLLERFDKLELARQKIAQVQILQPNWQRAQILQAHIAMRQGAVAQAITILKAIRQDAPANRQVRKMLIKALVASQQLDAARDLYIEAIDDNPSGDNQFGLVAILVAQQKYQQVLDYLQELKDQPKWRQRALFYSGTVEYKRQHWQQALEFWDKVSVGSYHYQAQSMVISVLLQQKLFIKAKQRLLQLATRYPHKKIDIALQGAYIATKQNLHQEAFIVLSDALVLSPKNRRLLYTRGLTANKLGKLGIAEKDLKSILASNPNDSDALNALGYSLANKTTRYTEAAKYLQQAIKLKPYDAMIIDSVGWLQFKRGNNSKALGYLQKAYDKSPQTEIAVHLVEVLLAVGNPKQAREIFGKFLKSEPANQSLLDLLSRFPQLQSK